MKKFLLLLLLPLFLTGCSAYGLTRQQEIEKQLSCLREKKEYIQIDNGTISEDVICVTQEEKEYLTK